MSFESYTKSPDRIASRTSMDGLVKVLTAFIIILFFYFVIDGLIRRAAGAPIDTNIGGAAILLACIVFSYALMPYEYAIENEELKILRPFGAIVIPLSNITRVSVLDTSARPRLRLFGIGGLFGYFGIYWLPKLGTATLMTRNTKNLAHIEFSERKPIVISPDDTSFLSELGGVTIDEG